MVQPLAQLSHNGTESRVDPVRIAARFRRGGEPILEIRKDALDSGARRLAAGDLELVLRREEHRTAATLHGSLRNRGSTPLYVESIEFGLEFCGHGHSAFRFLRHGWQSWSPTGVRSLTPEGESEFPSGPWLRGMYHCQGEPRFGWHESETMTLVGGMAAGPFCLVGALETGRAFGIARLLAGPEAEAGRPVIIDLELRLEVTLEPGETRELEGVRVALGLEANPLMERFAELWGTVGGARRKSSFQAGWCSWYHFFHDVSEQDLLRNLEALAADTSGIPVQVVQLDDGFQPTMGDWLEPSARFPSGLAGVASAIRRAGFRAGIWTAPFAVSAESRVLSQHPHWVLRDGESRLRGTYNPAWSRDGWVYVLDPSQNEVLKHLEETFSALVDLGFDYLKLDFLFMPAMRGQGADPSLTRAQRLRRGLEAIRRGAGEDAFLLGCGSPLGPAVGLVDGMRIGPDVAPSWEVDQPVVLPGLEEMLPSTRTALRSTFARQFLHRRLWLNDPDCLMVRSRETSLSSSESASLAAGVALSGGMVVFSDDVPLLEPAERDAIANVVALAKRIDAGGGARGTARVAWPQDAGGPCLVESRAGRDLWLGAVNLGNEAALCPFPADSALSSPEVSPNWLDGLGSPGSVSSSVRAFQLEAHGSAVVHAPRVLKPAVFCDFDGTFSLRDVGASLAREHLAEKRSALKKRYDEGELGAWDYALELFEGFAFPAERLDAFLAEIELDPGARSLLDWCEKEGVPFRILSDGFDYNLERLQAVHGVTFSYSANHLGFEQGRWRIAPGAFNAACWCGTGVCKRSLIEAYRWAHPGSLCIHIGDGQVSDLCAAEVADLIFAKGTLADALAARGIFYEPFDDLNAVRTYLARFLG